MSVRIIVSSLIIAVIIAATARADHGSIGVWADQSATNCAISDMATGTQTLYVVMTQTSGWVAARFRVEHSSGMNMTLISESYTGATTGDVLSGITVCNVACLPAPTLIATLEYLKDGTSADCSTITIGAYPGSIDPEVVNCGRVFRYVETHTATVNGNAINCPSPTCGYELRFGTSPSWDFCPAVPIEETTWGRIKALFN